MYPTDWNERKLPETAPETRLPLIENDVTEKKILCCKIEKSPTIIQDFGSEYWTRSIVRSLYILVVIYRAEGITHSRSSRLKSAFYVY